jgi:hypothetical protein
MDDTWNKFLIIGFFFLALLFCSCHHSSFLCRKYMPRSNGENKELLLAEEKVIVPVSSVSSGNKKVSACKTMPDLICEEGSEDSFPNQDISRPAFHPIFKSFLGQKRYKQEYANIQILLAQHSRSLKDTAVGKQVQSARSAKTLGRESLLIPAGSLVLLSVAAILLPGTPLVPMIGIVVFFAFILGLALGIKSYRAARLNKEKMPLAGKFGIVLSALGTLIAFILLIAIIVLMKGGGFSIDIPLNLH